MPTEKYHVTIKILHWLMAIIILSMIACGWYMSELPKEDPMRSTFYGLHKSFGVVILILFFVRVVARLITKAPELPVGIPKLQQKLALLGHKLLYLFMFIVPLSGYAMSNLHGYAVKMFGMSMPKIFPDNKALGGVAHEAHEILPYVLLAIVVLHAVAAVQHRFFDKPGNDVLGRML